MYDTILVPVDLAHPGKAQAMLAAARALANKGAEVILANVIEDIPTYVAVEMPAGILEKSREAARKELEEIAEHSGLKPRIETRIGHVSTAILEMAEQEKVDCIIVASHKPGLQDYFLGSTAARVVRHAKCAVHVLR